MVLAAAAAHDIVEFTVLPLTLDADADDERTVDDDDLQLVFLATTDTDAGLLVEVVEVFKADVSVVMDETVEVQCTGGLGKAVGAGAS